MDIRTLPHIYPSGSPPPDARQMPQPKDGGPGTTRLTVSLSTELVERLRDTVFGISQGTLSGLVSQAIEEALRQLEAHHGGRFPRRTRELKAGRPRKKKVSPPAAVSRAAFHSTTHTGAAGPVFGGTIDHAGSSRRAQAGQSAAQE